MRPPESNILGGSRIDFKKEQKMFPPAEEWIKYEVTKVIVGLENKKEM